MADGIVAGGGRFNRSSFSWVWISGSGQDQARVVPQADIRAGRRLPARSAWLGDDELRQGGVDLVGGQPMLCGPPSTVTSLASLTRPGSRAVRWSGPACLRPGLAGW